MHTDKHREFADTIATYLANRDNRYSVEVRESPSNDRRIYIGVTKESTREYYQIVIDR